MSGSERVRVDMRLPKVLVARVDGVRGDVPRSRWIERAVEHGLLAWEAPTRSATPFVGASVQVSPGAGFAPRVSSAEAKRKWTGR